MARRYDNTNRKPINTVRFTLRISPELHRRLNAEAARTGRKMSELARDAMIDGLDLKERVGRHG